MISNVSFQAPPFMENIHANVKDIPEGILYIYQCLGNVSRDDRLFLFSNSQHKVLTVKNTFIVPMIYQSVSNSSSVHITLSASKRRV